MSESSDNYIFFESDRFIEELIINTEIKTECNILFTDGWGGYERIIAVSGFMNNIFPWCVYVLLYMTILRILEALFS